MADCKHGSCDDCELPCSYEPTGGEKVVRCEMGSCDWHRMGSRWGYRRCTAKSARGRKMSIVNLPPSWCPLPITVRREGDGK